MNKELVSCTGLGLFLYAWYQSQITLSMSPYLVGGSMVLGSSILWALEEKKSVRNRIMLVTKNLKLGIKTDEKMLLPRITHYHKEEYGWKFILAVPPGLSEKKFIENLRGFETTLNSEVEIYERHGKIHMKVYSHELPTKIKGGLMVNDGTDRGE